MNKIKIILIIALMGIFVLWNDIAAAQQLAFPTAEGPGKYATGGRGGKVLKVTSLQDNSNTGTLRWAVSQRGARTIVFEVSGTIYLNSQLNISNGDLTIAGQTAPGDGITVAGYPTGIDANNVIIRYLRFRLGDINGVEGDAFGGRGVENIIIDHCSFSWSVDETVSLYNNSDVSFQWSMVTESLNNSVHSKGPHGYGGIWGGGPGDGQAAFHHNLIAHHTSRNPRFAGFSYAGERDDKYVDFRNNVLYNWGGQSVYGGEAQNQNMVANYYKYGPATGPKDRIVEPSSPYGDWYIADNFVFGYPEITKDNWNGGVQPAKGRIDRPNDIEHSMTHSAENAYELVLADVGAVLPARDGVDARIVEEVRTQTATYGDNGIIDSQSEVGGFPELADGTPPEDADDDGMPDDWENDMGLNPGDASDRNGDLDSDGYTNLEEYLNSLTERTNYLLSPAELTGEATSPSHINLSWKEITPFEDGFTLERSEGDTNSFVEIADLSENTTSFQDNGLSAETVYYYRVTAYNQNTSSIPSNVEPVKTLYADGRPLEPSTPAPSDSAEDADVLPLLEWEEADGAETYDIYLGTENPPPLVAEDVTETSYRPQTQLKNSTTYYWRVDSKNASGITTGKVWQFQTGVYHEMLAGYWTFDFQAGGFTPDSSAVDNWGYLSEDMSNDNVIDGIAGKAFSFDGADDFVYIEHLFPYEFEARSFSVSFWMNTTNASQNGYLFSKGKFPDDEPAEGFAVYATADGNMVFRVGDRETESVITTDISPFTTGQWVKLTAIRNREIGKLQLFAGSEKVASVTDSSWNIQNGARIYIGASMAGTNYYEGAIDNIRLNNYALDESEVGGLVTTGTEDVSIPREYALNLRNYPNPFNPETTLEYTVPTAGEVYINVYNLLGQQVANLVQGQKEPGRYAVRFGGPEYSSGIYIARITVNGESKLTKMMLVQ
ncbi:MAG: T9SS type A sorting domain-containing protein [Candidatus Marinimicrobia bacterium]|nr:T9SS type A sorting domain-containing protein [Candidatus Neomarinimicrobiota bacterium]MCF7827410.1 T9SS type A sorting domain-containing protein [Candidatus Neomarinimicrobiota bacterium]MCF7881357.1 T9SS type A sorting domain-containing protein [Candidatus Neomarinimicrobiota bacterium]